MQRIGLLINVKPEMLEEYKAVHANVWPDLLSELKKAGMRNYSLWLCPNGTEFGYLECENWQAACDYLDQSEVHARWQEYMKNYLESPSDPAMGGQPVQLLEMSFLME